MMWEKLRWWIWQRRGVLLTVPTIAGLVIALRLTGLLQLLEMAMFDQFVLLRPLEKPDSRIVIVALTEADIQKMQQSSMPDAVLAKLLTHIKKQQPAAIGLDIYRDLPVNPGHSTLLKVFKSTPNLIGVQKVAESIDSSPVAPPPVLKKNDQVGSNDLPLDHDGKVRRVLLYLDDKEGNTIFSFSFKLASLYLKNKGIEPELTADNQVKLGSAIFPAFSANDGGYRNAEAGGYQVLLNYRGQIQQFPTISVTEVLENRIPSHLMRDRIVLIGTTAESLKDVFYTSYSSSLLSAPQRTPGVAIHANAISQILSASLENRPLIRTWSEPIEWAWIGLWAMIGTTLSWKQRHINAETTKNYRASLLAGSVFLAGGCLLTGSYLAFLQGWWIPIVPPMWALAGSSIAIIAYIARTASEIRKTFGRYLTDQVVASLLESPKGLKIGGERRKITILTSDLRGFTSTSELLPPEEVVKILNIYLAAMTDVITAYQGTIDEFMGDGILVLFGAPTQWVDDAERAVACAVAMQLAIAPVNEKLEQLGWSKLEMGIGINTGEVVVGNIGSEKRTKYSVIGSHVNLTYRIESFTIGGQILISESTLKEVESIVKINGKIQVQAKGIKHPISVYDVGGIAGKYNLFLSKQEEAFFPLPQEIPLQYVLLDGKHVDRNQFKGSLVKLSERGAEIHVDEVGEDAIFSELTNIKLNLFLPDNPTEASDDIYAKVLQQLEDKRSFYIHFTAKSPKIQAELENLYQSIASKN